MNNQDAIKAFPGLGDIDENFLNKAMIDRSITGTANYEPNDKNINLCAADIYSFAVNDPDFAESSLSIKISRSSMIKTAKRLYIDNGEPEKAKALTGTHKINSDPIW